MKHRFVIAILFLFAIGCNKDDLLTINSVKHQIIALQPLDDFDEQHLSALQEILSDYFQKQVIILSSVSVPVSFLNREINQYSADSLIIMLSTLKNDSIIEVIGITHHKLYTMKYNDSIEEYYYDEGIFGCGFEPGNACVVSDHKFKTTNEKLYNRRMKNTILHEVGHNMGLSHCNAECVMSTRYGYFSVLNSNDGDYCIDCRKKLGD